MFHAGNVVGNLHGRHYVSRYRPCFLSETVSARSHQPVVVWTIIGINVAAFLYQLSLTAPELQVFLYEHALVPRRYFSPRWAMDIGLSPTDLTPFVTNTFIHGGFLHIILNLWTLWIFGPALEDRWGGSLSCPLSGVGSDRECRARVLQCWLNSPRSRSLRSHRRCHRCLRRTLPLCVGESAGAACHHPAFLRHPGHGVRGHLVLHASRPGHGRAVQPIRGQRHRVVGAHRRVLGRLGSLELARADDPRCGDGCLVQRRPLGRAGSDAVTGTVGVDPAPFTCYEQTTNILGGARWTPWSNFGRVSRRLSANGCGSTTR